MRDVVKQCYISDTPAYKWNNLQDKHQHRAQQIQIRERRRPIVGLADDDNGLHATPMPNQDFFVYRVHKDDGVDVMSEYLRRKNVVVHEIIKKSHESSKFNSFKVAFK